MIMRFSRLSLFTILLAVTIVYKCTKKIIFRFGGRMPTLRAIPSYIPPDIFKWGNSSKLEPIHLLIVATKMCSIRQTMTMLKTMLYFQGRFQTHSPICEFEVKRSPEIRCERKRTRNITGLPKYQPLRLHWIVNPADRQYVLSLFSQWKPVDIELHLYDSNWYEGHLRTIPSRHYAGMNPLYKLLVPYVLHPSISKVMLLDVDMLFNDNIENLWAEFDAFRPHQIIGMACEQHSHCPGSCPVNPEILPYHGSNGGVMLFNLTEMRRNNWHKIWQTEVLKEMREFGILMNGEQKVINQIFNWEPQLRHKLGCTWNVQASLSEGTKCCPVNWIDRSSDETNCVNLTATQSSSEPIVPQARVVHYNMPSKPENYGPYTGSSLEHVWGMGQMHVQQLRHKFLQVYRRFSNLPLDCFM